MSFINQGLIFVILLVAMVRAHALWTGGNDPVLEVLAGRVGRSVPPSFLREGGGGDQPCGKEQLVGVSERGATMLTARKG